MTAPAILYPLGDGIGSVAHVDHMGDDKRAVDAARVSLAGDGEPWREQSDPRLLRYLLAHGHWSPFQHCTATLALKVPLFLRSQIMRHASFAFNEVSARYTEVADEMYAPVQFRAQAQDNRQASVDGSDLPQLAAARLWAEGQRAAFEAYQGLLDLGVAREQARGVLPQAAYTRFYMTGSLRSWLHFLQARDHPGAQWEAQQVARAIAELLEPLFPVTFREWRTLEASRHADH
ncbi:FAD-dependent thymidylate synthase [Deinococcus petrolearius]|uniref:Flavin-dependent thymidylate synthase n=1 Tax=Deinococcus petrolearius TaxID=1751295 RepID=A0ABW1DD62_9DEIO